MIEGKLLKILCCPATRQSLRSADEETVARLNARIPGGGLLNQAGEAVRDSFEEGLLREDGKMLYPMRQGVPVLLVSAGIEIGDDKPTENVEGQPDGEEADEGD